MAKFQGCCTSLKGKSSTKSSDNNISPFCATALFVFVL